MSYQRAPPGGAGKSAILLKRLPACPVQRWQKKNAQLQPWRSYLGPLLGVKRVSINRKNEAQQTCTFILYMNFCLFITKTSAHLGLGLKIAARMAVVQLLRLLSERTIHHDSALPW